MKLALCSALPDKSLSPALAVSVISPPFGVAKVVHSLFPHVSLSLFCVLSRYSYYQTCMLNLWSSTHVTRPILRTLKHVYRVGIETEKLLSTDAFPQFGESARRSTPRSKSKQFGLFVVYKNLFYLGIHVTPVGWSGLSIYAVIAIRHIIKVHWHCYL